MIKRILTLIILVAAVAVSALFTWLNPGQIELDLGFAAFETPLGVAFVLAIALGWLLGLASTLWWVARIAADRRRLRAELRNTSLGSATVRDERG